MLDELVDVIETLKSRINEHRAVLQGNEAQTRVSLIDPLLRALGWDTADPALVRPEYNVRGKRADYALLDWQGNAAVLLEAKKLSEPLSAHRSQVAAYASELGIKYPALTNGSKWEMYDNSIFVPIEQRRILNVSIADDPSTECAKQFSLLLRSNLESARPAQASEPIPVTQSKGGSVPTSKTPATGVWQRPRSGRFAETSKPPTMGDWRRPRPNHFLATSKTLNTAWIALKDIPTIYGSKWPTAVRFPNGEEKFTKIWVDLLIEVVEWLIRDGVLTSSECPIPDAYNLARNAIHIQPKHPNETEFYAPHRLSNGLFLCGRGPRKIHIDRCIALMEYFGKDPSTVHVQVG